MLDKFEIELSNRYPNRVDYTVVQVKSILSDTLCMERAFGGNSDAAFVLLSEALDSKGIHHAITPILRLYG